jgi:hypothetical protein
MSAWEMQVVLDKKRDNENVHAELLSVLMVGMVVIVSIIDRRSSDIVLSVNADK